MEALLIYIKLLVNYQDHNQVLHYLVINTQVLTILLNNSLNMIQKQEKYWKYMINRQDKLMLLQCNMMFIMLFVNMIENVKPMLIGKSFKPKLDNSPYSERQWGHFLARNVINTKQKLGLGVKKPKKLKSRRVKKIIGRNS